MEIDENCSKCYLNKGEYILTCCNSKICSQCKGNINTLILHQCFNSKCLNLIVDQNYKRLKNFDKCIVHDEDLLNYICIVHYVHICEKCMKYEHCECEIKRWEEEDCKKIIKQNLLNFTAEIKKKIESFEISLQLKDPLELLQISINTEKNLNFSALKTNSYFTMFNNYKLLYNLDVC